MFSTSAPYVITIIMSVVTWALTNFYEGISTATYLQYSISEDKDQAGIEYRTYLFENRSAKSAIKDLDLALLREGNGPAFSLQNVRIINVAPWSIRYFPNVEANSIIQKVYLPVGRAFKIRFQVSHSDNIYIYTSSTSEDMNSIILSDCFNFEIFIANYYIYIVFSMAIVSAVLLAVLGRSRRPAAPEEQVITVKIAKE